MLPSLTSTGDECACSCAGSVVASFPGSHVWAEEKQPGTLFVHAQFLQDFWV